MNATTCAPRRTKTPRTLADLLRAITHAGRLDAWAMGTAPARPADAAPCRALWLADGTPQAAMVAFEFGRLIVTLDGWYWFELERLHEHAPHNWSWQQQIGGKDWATPEHLRLLDELCAVIPPPPAL